MTIIYFYYIFIFLFGIKLEKYNFNKPYKEIVYEIFKIKFYSILTQKQNIAINKLLLKKYFIYQKNLFQQNLKHLKAINLNIKIIKIWIYTYIAPTC